MDTEHWMTNLPCTVKQSSIIHIAIPGSHDSMTSSINSHCKLSPDADPFFQHLQFLGPILRLIMSRWCKTQSFTLLQQLKQGIRYFDFRVATKPGSNQYFVHGLYATEVVGAVNDLSNFLNTHPKEVVIIDFQHFYAFEQQDHENLMNLLFVTFNTKLTPYTHDMEDLSLSYLEKSGYQLFIVYRSAEQALYSLPLFWPSANFPTPWPQTVSLPELIMKLDRGLSNRSSNYGYVSQFVLTPTSWFVSKHIFSTLKAQCVMPILKAKLEWIQKQKTGPEGVNIIICDFIELDNYDFAKEVINLNFKNMSYEASLTPVQYEKL